MVLDSPSAAQNSARRSPLKGAIDRAFDWVLFVAAFGVFASVLLAATLYAATAVQAVVLAASSFSSITDHAVVGKLMISGVELADALLVATGLLVVAVGLYSLFVSRLDDVPEWMRVSDFDSLKHKLISVVVAAICVRFFSLIMRTDVRGLDALYFGAAIGCVLTGLACYLSAVAWLARSRRKDHQL